MMLFGLGPRHVDLIMFNTIQQLEHFIRTEFGDSTISFGGEEITRSDPLHGLGQGIANGPPVCNVLSTPLFDMLRRVGYGVKMVSAIGSEELHFVAYSIVDDTSHGGARERRRRRPSIFGKEASELPAAQLFLVLGLDPSPGRTASSATNPSPNSPVRQPFETPRDGESLLSDWKPTRQDEPLAYVQPRMETCEPK